MEAEPNALLCTAIREKRLMRLQYKGRERIVEPHDYGIRNGAAKVLTFQVAGFSSHKLPNWRWMDENLISNIELLDKKFAGGRPPASGKHHTWDKLFIRVEPNEHVAH